MRETFQDDLDWIGHQLVEMTNLAGSALRRATAALLDADIKTAESVIDDDSQIDHIRAEIEREAFVLLARQQPVATDLRIVVTALQMALDLERMGDLAAHIAKVARLRYPKQAVPESLRPVIEKMAQYAGQNVAKASTTIASRDAERAHELPTDDDAVDELHRQLFAAVLAPDWSHGIEKAVDITLLGRYYERFSDHAVALARRIIYVVTGETLDLSAATTSIGAAQLKNLASDVP